MYITKLFLTQGDKWECCCSCWIWGIPCKWKPFCLIIKIAYVGEFLNLSFHLNLQIYLSSPINIQASYLWSYINIYKSYVHGYILFGNDFILKFSWANDLSLAFITCFQYKDGNKIKWKFGFHHIKIPICSLVQLYTHTHTQSGLHFFYLMVLQLDFSESLQ